MVYMVIIYNCGKVIVLEDKLLFEKLCEKIKFDKNLIYSTKQTDCTVEKISDACKLLQMTIQTDTNL